MARGRRRGCLTTCFCSLRWGDSDVWAETCAAVYSEDIAWECYAECRSTMEMGYISIAIFHPPDPLDPHKRVW